MREWIVAHGYADLGLQVVALALFLLVTLFAISGAPYWLWWLIHLSRTDEMARFTAKEIPGLRRGRVGSQEFEFGDAAQSVPTAPPVAPGLRPPNRGRVSHARLDQLDQRSAEEAQILVRAGAPGPGERGVVAAEAVTEHRGGIAGQTDSPPFPSRGRILDRGLDQPPRGALLAAPGGQASDAYRRGAWPVASVMVSAS